MSLHNTLTRQDVDEAAAAVMYWDRSEVLNTINVSEALTIAALFAGLGRHDAAEHIVRETWHGEAEDSRDPLPYVNGHGSRIAELTDAERHNEGDERFHFEPRGLGWEID